MSIDFLKSLYFEFLSFFVPQRVTYKIKGECLKCGQCCRNIRSYGLKSEFEFKIMQFFIPAYRSFFITGKDEHNNFILSCTHLTINNLCDCYSKRPQVCKNYPAKSIKQNLDLIDGCGFKIFKKSFNDFLKILPTLLCIFLPNLV